MALEEINSGKQLAFTGVDGPCDRKVRKALWKELAAINGIISQPWSVGGDFNVIRFAYEKLGEARNSRAISSRVVNELSLIDPPLHGGNFTWFRSRDSSCASRIDRFFFSEKWDECFKSIRQRVFPRTTSDHCPILLECGDWKKKKRLLQI